MTPNTQESIEFLQKWSPDGPWVLTAIIPDGGRTTTVTFSKDKVEDVRAWIDVRQGRQNIYFTVNPVIKSVNSKPKKIDIKGMKALHVDIDPRVGEEIDSERERAERLLRSFNPPPTVILDSGGGFQGFWLLDELQVTNGDEIKTVELEAYNLQIEVQLQADACHNIDRIMRLPGTINIPGEKKRKKGRKEALSRVVEADWSKVYPLSAFTPAPRVQLGDSYGPEVKLSGNLPRLDSLDDLPTTVNDKTKALIVQGDDPDDPTKYPSRSEALFAVLCEMVRADCSDDQIAAVILDPDYGISGHVLDQPRPQQYAARQIQRAREEAINPYLRKLNEEHAVIEDIGGKCRVISEVMDIALERTRISRQSFEDFRNRYMHVSVSIGKDKDGNDIKQPLGKWWLQHPQRRQYKTLLFAPGREVKDSYNLWKGFSCEARPGDCSLFLAHLRDNICCGVDLHYEYLLNWMARCVQRPDTPGEVAVILRGRMGTGKGMFVKGFGSIWGRHFLQITDSKHLVGSFNAHLRDCVVLFADEAFYAGDKKHEAILKGLVTEETIMIEGKGVDAEASPNYVHLIMASNSDWVVPAGADERRYFVLDVADNRMQDKAYFKAIRDQMDNGGREALLHMLLSRDLSDFEVRNFPKTAALQDQKILSLDQDEVWWYEKLVDGRLLRHQDNWPSEVTKNDIQKDYLDWCEQQRHMRRMTPMALRRFLKKVMPGSFPHGTQRYVDVNYQDSFGHESYRKERVWSYSLPPLSECRDYWDTKFGGPYEWPEDIAESNDPPF
jgi:hypothetical protein